MNILIVSAQFPYPPRSGFGMRVYQLARQLSRRHRVTLLSYVQPEDQEAVASLSEQMTVRAVPRDQTSIGARRAAQAFGMVSARPFSCRAVSSQRMQQAIDELCAREAFDVVQLEGSLLCTFAFPAGLRVVLDEHNVEYEIFRRMCEGERSLPRRAFNRVEHARFRRFEQGWWRRVDGCVVTSEREVPIVHSHAPDTPLAVVPNGVDLDYFTPNGHEIQPHTVVFNGILNYRPNVDAAHYLVEEVWPLVVDNCPQARLTIVGYASAADIRGLQRPGVVLTGKVPDIRPYLGAAAVVAVPVRIGGGTRLKVVEGLAMGKAMVSTSLGCEGIDVRDGEHLLIGDDAEAFASRIVQLFDKPALGAALGRAGRDLMAKRYSWEMAGERLETLHQQAAERRPAAAKGEAVSPLVSTVSRDDASSQQVWAAR